MNKLAEAIFIIRGLRREAAVVGSDTLSSCGVRVVLLPCCGDYSIIELIKRMMQRCSSPEDR